jgi:predicted HicB family RNase H-like nuclease
MVNINIQIPDELHKKIKLNAVKEDTSIKDLIIRKLEDYTSKKKDS